MENFFDANRRENPFKDGKRLDFELDMLMKIHRVANPPGEQEVVLIPAFLRKTYDRASNSKEKHLSFSCIVALFFAMGSCEHLLTSGSRKTMKACLKDISFRNYREGAIDQSSEDILHAAAVRMTFREQNIGEK